MGVDRFQTSVGDQLGRGGKISCPECMGLKTDISGMNCKACGGLGMVDKSKAKVNDIFDPKV